MNETPENSRQSGHKPPEEADGADQQASEDDERRLADEIERDPAYNPDDEILRDIKGG